MSMSSELDIAVIGAGIVGLSTAYSLRERGAAVRVYERGKPGNGQSGGEGRIFRHAHDDPRLVRFAIRSREVWREWQERLGVELVSSDGVVALGPPVERRLAVLDEVGGVRAHPITPDEVAERLPLLAHYSGPAMFDHDGGAIRTSAAIEALAAALADALVTDEVIAIRHDGHGEVEVQAGGSRHHYSRVVVCAGRSTTHLARDVGLSLPVRAAAHVRCMFAVRAQPPARLACLQDGSGDFGETGTYATPEPGNRRYSVGLSETVEVQGDGSLFDPGGLAELGDRASAYVRQALPGLDPEPLEPRHCWVTNLPWSSDGLAVWESEGIFFVGGHNLFKQAPGLGRALARAAMGEELQSELRPEAKLGERRSTATV